MNTRISRVAALGLACVMSSALAEPVVVGGAASPATAVSAEQVAALYTMRLKSLPGGGAVQLVVVEATKPQLYGFLGKSEDQIKAIWARHLFSGSATPPLEVATPADARKAMGNPNAIAVIDSAAVDASMKVVGKL